MVAQWLERATPSQEVMGLIPMLAPYWFDWYLVETKVMVSPLSHMWQQVILSDISLGICLQDSLVADKDV